MSVMPKNMMRTFRSRPKPGGGTIQTLDGSARYRKATINDVRIGSQRFDGVTIAVADVSFPTPLLGQDLLRRLGPVTIDGDTLTLR